MSAAQRSKLEAPWVLLVVKDADTREYLTLTLKRHLAGVIPAANADDALLGLGALLPDVVVAELRPDGLRLLEAIRRLPRERGGALPAIALIKGGGDDEAAAIDAGFVVQLRTPVDPDDLRAAIEILAAGSPGPTRPRPRAPFVRPQKTR